MKKVYLILAAAVGMTITSCTTNDYLGDVNNDQAINDGSIQFGLKFQNMTRAGEFVGATAADKLGNMFVVEGTKGKTFPATSPTTDVVFDNYLVGYTANTAGTTKSNTHNWEYVGKQTGITSRMTGATWTALHSTGAQVQSIKYWDYSTVQYDFIAWSTGTCEAIPVPSPAEEPAAGKVQVSRINTGSTLVSNGFTMRASSAEDLMQCYYTDINTVEKANYNKPVTLTFKNMAAKVRVALYETIPGYSVKDVKFYTSDANPTAPTDLGTGSGVAAKLFTMGSDVLPQSGTVTVMYPRIGKTEHDASPRAVDYNKASIIVAPGDATSTTQAFGELTNQYRDETGYEPDGKYLGTSLPNATFAGDKTKDFYAAVIPNTNGKALTLRVDYTLVSTDGSAEEIKVYGAKAVVPSTYTVWQPNYAYTYIFKISDNTNGWTDTDHTKAGLFPITFDAVVTNFTDYNAEQTTVTTVATPSITTYQQGHTKSTDEYSKSQLAGKDATNVKDLYVQVMNNSGTPALATDLNGTNKSLLYLVSKDDASEAEVMDALQNRTNSYGDASPTGRNGITLTTNANIKNDVTSIVNGVDDQPITQIAGVNIAAGQVAKIDIDQLTAGKTYAYVYATTVPSSEEQIYQVAADATNEASVKDKYYDVDPSTLISAAESTAQLNKVYFVANRDAQNNIVSYTFKQTKVGDPVTGLFEATIAPATKASTYTDGHFYLDVYNQNNGAYAVKVFKVVL